MGNYEPPNFLTLKIERSNFKENTREKYFGIERRALGASFESYIQVL